VLTGHQLGARATLSATGEYAHDREANPQSDYCCLQSIAIEVVFAEKVCRAGGLHMHMTAFGEAKSVTRIFDQNTG